MPVRVRCLLILFGIALLHALVARAANPQPYKVDLASSGQGDLDGTLKSTSQLIALRTTAPVDPYGLIARARGDIDRLKTVLESYGYYDGTVTITINGLALDHPQLGDTLSALPKNTDASVKVAFELGPLYHLGSVSLAGPVPPAQRPALALASGAPAIASDVLAAGARLQSALQDAGYAFAKVEAPVAYMDPRQHLLNVSYPVVSGPKVAVGEIRFQGMKHVKVPLLRRRLLLHTGDPYSAAAVEKARRDLLALGVFSTVSVRLGSAPDSMGRVPITFETAERKRYTFGINAAYSSDLGGSGGVSWGDRDVFGGAQQLNLSATATNIGGTASTGLGYDVIARYTLPDFYRRDQSLAFTLTGLRQELQAYGQTAEIGSGILSRKLSDVWTGSVGASFEVENIEQFIGTNPDGTQQAISGTYFLVALPLAVNYDSTHLPSPLEDPAGGLRGSVSLAPTASIGLHGLTTCGTKETPNAQCPRNAVFQITQFSLAEYLDFHGLFKSAPGRSVLAIRELVAVALRASDILQLPADQRFYAGGSGTVRGYRYQSVGPQYENGNPVGGLSMMAVNLEYRQRFGGTNFGAAFFVDGGSVGEGHNPLARSTEYYSSLTHTTSCGVTAPVPSSVSPTGQRCSNFRVGVGTGVRYYTPIGAIRVDVALPTSRRQNDDRFEVYIGLGQAY